jgi:glucosamine--fructose-6-phosphate aminotransferase (isomerizing)
MVQTHTYQEIKQQPATWRQTIDLVVARAEEVKQKFANIQPDEVIFTGCGTSCYISIAAALTFQEKTGLSAKAVPASEIFLKPDAVFGKNKKTILVGSSRSGNTTEVVRAIEYARQNNLARCIAITSLPTSDLACKSDYTISLPHVQEKSVVMTSSFTNILLVSQLIAGILSGDEAYLAELKRLPEIGEDVMARVEPLAKTVGEDQNFNHFIYLGLGACFGLANEGMLKLKEMTQLFAETFNPLEFRHGPISVLNEKCRVILLSNRSIQAYERDVVDDVRKFGANAVVIGDSLEDFRCDVKIELNSGLTDLSRSVLYLPFLQLLAYYRTLKLGLNPDQPRNLGKVVVLKTRFG